MNFSSVGNSEHKITSCSAVPILAANSNGEASFASGATGVGDGFTVCPLTPSPKIKIVIDSSIAFLI
ncbi:hypothetical protein, partial [Acinetobacter baumannii]|uniref:hypothetical protein n=1 Tax=Acinetobacter baumannii TaxID=470 RepID=UPI0024B7121D